MCMCVWLCCCCSERHLGKTYSLSSLFVLFCLKNCEKPNFNNEKNYMRNSSFFSEKDLFVQNLTFFCPDFCYSLIFHDEQDIMNNKIWAKNRQILCRNGLPQLHCLNLSAKLTAIIYIRHVVLNILSTLNPNKCYICKCIKNRWHARKLRISSIFRGSLYVWNIIWLRVLVLLWMSRESGP